MGDFAPGAAAPSDVYLSPALVRRMRNTALAGDIEEVRLRHGAASIPAFQAAISRFGGSSGLQMQNMDGEGLLVERSIHLQAVGWWLLAAVAGLAGIAVVGQILARQAAADAADYPVLRALGMSSGRLFMLGMTRVSAMAVVGGPHRSRSPSRCRRWRRWGKRPSPSRPRACVSIPPCCCGACWPCWSSWWRWLPGPCSPRPGGAGPLAAGRGKPAPPGRRGSWPAGPGGASASVLVGARGALERGRGREAVPTATVLLCTVLGTAALAGGIVFGASLTHLLITPRLYGVSYDFEISSDQPERHPGAADAAARPPRQRDHRRGRGSAAHRQPDRGHAGRRQLQRAGAADRDSGPVPVPPGPDRARRGHAPPARRPHRQPGTGHDRATHAAVHGGGDGGVPRVRLHRRARHGGRHDACRLSRGSLPSRRPDAGCPVVPDGILVRLRPGPGTRQPYPRQRTYAASFAAPVKPASLVNFGQVAGLPPLLGLAVAVFGAATLLHFLLVTVARRRRQVGTLKALGFLRRQVAAAVTWQAETVAAFALVLGVPLGLAAGRFAWNLAASDFGVPSVVIAPWPALAAASAGTLAAAAIIAAGPATSRPACARPPPALGIANNHQRMSYRPGRRRCPPPGYQAGCSQRCLPERNPGADGSAWPAVAAYRTPNM